MSCEWRSGGVEEDRINRIYRIKIYGYGFNAEAQRRRVRREFLLRLRRDDCKSDFCAQAFERKALRRAPDCRLTATGSS